MPACDLEQLFGTSVDQLPEKEDTSCVISVATLPQSPAILSTDQFVIRTGRHGYHSYTHACIDALHFQAHKRAYRLLGLCFLSKVFHPEPREIQIQFTNPHSAVHTLILDYNQADSWNLIAGYNTRPYTYEYEPKPVVKNTSILDAHYFPPWFLPLFTLTDSANVAGPCDDRDVRDTVRCAGSDYGSVIFATVLLNFGRVAQFVQEFTLEGEYGYDGVGRGSAEVTLWLPASDGWLDVV